MQRFLELIRRRPLDIESHGLTLLVTVAVLTTLLFVGGCVTLLLTSQWLIGCGLAAAALLLLHGAGRYFEHWAKADLTEATLRRDYAQARLAEWELEDETERV
jgi:high-affinity Fe2+/Pb2+ permease